MLVSLAASSSYFRIKGGNTVVEKRGSEWIRWDLWDGPVSTGLWTVGDPQLEPITVENASELISEHM